MNTIKTIDEFVDKHGHILRKGIPLNGLSLALAEKANEQMRADLEALMAEKDREIKRLKGEVNRQDKRINELEDYLESLGEL